MDRITLGGIRAYGRHGVKPRERAEGQPFDVELCLELDLADAGHSDRLTDTIDYARLHERIVTVVEVTSFALLERLATEILEVAFADLRVARAIVTIAKPGILDGATPSVTLARSNPRFDPQA
ncbi:MAG: dihydroneopterin aldolase [Candidatus Eremiobacteraeota bacterium]|nr:dihydroneopterin aldolase [Candidatus Eremiobacteraeota bacterium]